MDIGQGTLSKYETGLLPPPDEAIDRMMKVLRFPRSFFFLPEQSYGMPPFHFRKRKKLGKKALNRIIAEMNIRRMHIKDLSISYERESTGFIPEIDLDEFQGLSKRRPTIEEIAQHVRGLWKVPSGPIENMTALIERNGGIVVPCNFGVDLIDAMSQRIDGMPVCFFINKSAPADRVRYTLAHELGHMILHTLELSDDDTMEDQADEFAGAFLLPAAEFAPQISRRFDLPHIANLKGYWKVSMAMIAMRATRLNLISPYQQKMFWVQMRDFRKHEPNEPVAEHPQTMSRMIGFHQRQLGYSETDMSRLLHLERDDFSAWYGDVDTRSNGRGTANLRLVT
jgi:Zn-dependent peptidase ImmA (M78 family)